FGRELCRSVEIIRLQPSLLVAGTVAGGIYACSRSQDKLLHTRTTGEIKQVCGRYGVDSKDVSGRVREITILMGLREMDDCVDLRQSRDRFAVGKIPVKRRHSGRHDTSGALQTDQFLSAPPEQRDEASADKSGCTGQQYSHCVPSV